MNDQRTWNSLALALKSKLPSYLARNRRQSYWMRPTDSQSTYTVTHALHPCGPVVDPGGTLLELAEVGLLSVYTQS